MLDVGGLWCVVNCDRGRSMKYVKREKLMTSVEKRDSKKA